MLESIAQFFTHPLAYYWVGLKLVFGIYLGALIVERLFPAEPNQPLRHIGFNLVYTLIFLFITVTLPPWLSQWIKSNLGDFQQGLIRITADDTVGGQLFLAFITLFVFDFFYYWFHRLQHEWTWLWPQHKLHHSDHSVNVTTGNRHHWLEEIIRVVLIIVPMSLLFNIKAPTLMLITFWMTFWGYFIHMNLRLKLGPLTPVIGGPQLHRIHHSVLPHHKNKNYAAFFPIYDIVFGSYCPPEKNEFPKTGLHTGQRLDTLRMAMFSPFIDWFNRLRGKPYTGSEANAPLD